MQVEQHLGNREVLKQRLDLAGLDFRQVEDVVDQRQELAAALMDDARRFDFVAVEVAGGVLGEVPGQDEDAVERRAQFVRHVGQELRLVAVGLGEFACARLGLAAAEFELPSLRFEAAVFLFQFFALYPQLLLGGQKFAVLDLELFGLTTHFVAQRMHFGVSLGEF